MSKSVTSATCSPRPVPSRTVRPVRQCLLCGRDDRVGAPGRRLGRQLSTGRQPGGSCSGNVHGREVAVAVTVVVAMVVVVAVAVEGNGAIRAIRLESRSARGCVLNQLTRLSLAAQKDICHHAGLFLVRRGVNGDEH